ncbi:STAS-like domain-containing protein [Idiomarina abyssalis]|uniref:STAS-like domain-containing protein n=1 Tax=Idiomarina abyssalis TaxID=86102 RepID=UPI003A91603E
MNTIKVFELSGKNAVSIQGGRKLHEKIKDDLLAGRSVELDFEGVKIFASPFFNSSIGVFIKDIPIQTLMQRLEVKNLEQNGKELLNHVIDNAIRYYKSEGSIKNAFDEDPSEH